MLTQEARRKGTAISSLNANDRWYEYAEYLGYEDEWEMFIDMYWCKRMSIDDVALKLGHAPSAVRYRMDLCGIKRRKGGRR